MRLVVTIAALAAAAALTGCEDPAPDAGPERRAAAGEVLGGEVSDDMIPLDTVRSASPPDPRAPAGSGSPADTGTAAPPIADLPSETQSELKVTDPNPQTSEEIVTDDPQ